MYPWAAGADDGSGCIYGAELEALGADALTGDDGTPLEHQPLDTPIAARER